MKQEQTPEPEIEVTVTGLLTTHHYFNASDGCWGELTLTPLSNHGCFRRDDGSEFVVRKVHWLGTAYELLVGGSIWGSADKPGVLSRYMVIDFRGRPYRLQPKGILKDGWFLSDAEGNRLLAARPRGILQEKTVLTTVSPLDQELVVFAYTLIYLWRQEEAAAAAATIAACAS